MKQINTPRFFVLTLLVIAAAATRAFPLFVAGTWNFTAVGALAIFAGAQFSDRRLAFLIPLASMALSDLFLGNGFNLLVYGAFMVMVACGFLIRRKVNVANVIMASFGSAFAFYLITNFAFFYPGLYTQDMSGIITSYGAALPFFRNMLVGNLVYSAVLFGGFYLLEQRYPTLARS